MTNESDSSEFINTVNYKSRIHDTESGGTFFIRIHLIVNIGSCEKAIYQKHEKQNNVMKYVVVPIGKPQITQEI